MTILYILYFRVILYIGDIVYIGEIGDIGDFLSKSLPRLTLWLWEPFLVQIVGFPYSELFTLSFVDSVQIVVFPYS